MASWPLPADRRAGARLRRGHAQRALGRPHVPAARRARPGAGGQGPENVWRRTSYSPGRLKITKAHQGSASLLSQAKADRLCPLISSVPVSPGRSPHIRLAAIELERADARRPVKAAGRDVVLLCVPEGAVVLRVDGHAAVVAPALVGVELN